MSARKAYVQPVSDSLSVFKDGIFDGKVLFCTGGGSGICKAMTEAVVSFSLQTGVEFGFTQSTSVLQMRHGANAVIVGRK